MAMKTNGGVIQMVAFPGLREVRSAGTRPRRHRAATGVRPGRRGRRCGGAAAAAARRCAASACPVERAAPAVADRAGGGGAGRCRARSRPIGAPSSSAAWRTSIAGGPRPGARRSRTSSTDIDYAVKLIGIDHVGISSDFDGGGGIDGWNSAAETFNVTLELVRRGYTEEQIAQDLERQSPARVGRGRTGRERDSDSEPLRKGEAFMTRRVRKAMLASLLVVAGWPSPGEARVVRFVVEQTRPGRGGEELRRRRTVRAARRHRLLRGRSARSAERGDRQPRQGAEDAEGAWWASRRRSTSSSRSTWRAATGRSSTASTTAATSSTTPGGRSCRARRDGQQQQPGRRRRLRRRAPFAARLHVRRRRLAGQPRAGRRPARPEPAGGHGGRRPADRRDASVSSSPTSRASPDRSTATSVTSSRSYETADIDTGTIDADGPRERRRREDADCRRTDGRSGAVQTGAASLVPTRPTSACSTGSRSIASTS